MTGQWSPGRRGPQVSDPICQSLSDTDGCDPRVRSGKTKRKRKWASSVATACWLALIVAGLAGQLDLVAHQAGYARWTSLALAWFLAPSLSLPLSRIAIPTSPPGVCLAVCFKWRILEPRNQWLRGDVRVRQVRAAKVA